MFYNLCQMMPVYRHMWEFASNVALKVKFCIQYTWKPPFHLRSERTTQYCEFTLVHAKTKPKRCQLFLVKHFGKTTFLSNVCVCVFTPLLSLALVRFLSPTYFSISVVAVDVFVCFHFRSFADIQFIQIIGSIHPWLVQSQVATRSCFVHIRPYSSYSILLVWLYTFVSLEKKRKKELKPQGKTFQTF